MSSILGSWGIIWGSEGLGSSTLQDLLPAAYIVSTLSLRHLCIMPATSLSKHSVALTSTISLSEMLSFLTHPSLMNMNAILSWFFLHQKKKLFIIPVFSFTQGLKTQAECSQILFQNVETRTFSLAPGKALHPPIRQELSFHCPLFSQGSCLPTPY